MDSRQELQGSRTVAVLSIGVGSFEEGSTREELGFVAARMNAVREAFAEFQVPARLFLDKTEGEIEALLRDRLVDDPHPADVTVVHLIGHGHHDRNGRLGLVAHDDREVDVDRWIEKAQQEIERDGNRRRVVFLVDTCSAGAATGRQSLAERSADRGVWALGATISSLPTEQGRFSQWIAAALHHVRIGDYTLNDDSVNFTEFVRQLIIVVRNAKPSWRLSLGFSLEQGDGDWPFLPNPTTAGLSPEQLRLRRRSLGYVPGEEDLRKDLGTRIAAGEEVEDAAYFYDRASGRGLISAGSAEGFFSGRVAELRRFAAWRAGDGPLLTVTGAAGAGKSGLLGVIVCGAHPELRERCHALWAHADPDLPEVPDLVAVHARHRTGRQLLDRIVRLADLALPKEDEYGRDEKAADKADSQDEVQWTPESLRAALEQEGKNRLIVIDAVDESSDPQSVLDLVAALVTPKGRRGGTGAAPCRILLGGRREVIDALPFSGRTTHRVDERIDLDRSDPATVVEDVRRYIERLLGSTEPYVTGPSAPFVGLLAKMGAERIVGGLRADSQWGPFLLAGLYAHHLLTLQTPPTNETAADAFGGHAYADLPQMLEAALKERRAVRAVLAVLARSKGDGMPRVTLLRCLRALLTDGITDDELGRVLREASPYLRTGADRESKTLYRIFQQGLADYLRDHPFGPDAVTADESLALEQALLSEIVGPFLAGPEEDSADRWHSAEPYVLQHALGHVMAAEAPEVAEALLTDPYFLIRFDARQDHRALDLCRSGEAAAYRRLLSASWSAHGKLRSAADRASVFVLDAERLGMPDHRRLFAGIVLEVALQPTETAYSLRWAAGGRVDDSSQFIETESTFYGSYVTLSPDGRFLAMATGGVRILETETWKQVARVSTEWLNGSVRHVTFSPDGRLLALSSYAWTRNILLWDRHHRVFLGEPWEYEHSGIGTPTALSFSADGGLLAVGSAEFEASVWDVGPAGPTEVIRLPRTKHADNVLFGPGGRLLVVCADEGTTLWRPETWDPVPLTDLDARAVAFSPDGSLLALLHEDHVTLWSCETFRRVGRIPVPQETSGSGLCFSGDGSLLCVVGWRVLCVVDVATREEVRSVEARDDINAAFFHPARPALLMSIHAGGRVRLWNRFAQDADAPGLVQFRTGDAAASPDGRLVAVVDGDDVLTLYDVDTGEARERLPLGPSSPSPDLYFSPDNAFLVVVGEDLLRVVRLGAAPLTVEEVRLAKSSFPRCALSPDSRRFALCSRVADSETYTIDVRDMTTLRPTHRIPLPDSPDALSFAGPDRLLVAMDGGLAVYDCPADPSEESPA